MYPPLRQPVSAGEEGVFVFPLINLSQKGHFIGFFRRLHRCFDR